MDSIQVDDGQKMSTQKLHQLPKGFDSDQTLEAVEALLTHATKAKVNPLFADTPSRLLLDVTSFKILEGQNHFFNICLPNSPYHESVDILMIIPDDLKTSTDPEILVNKMKDKLREADVNNIREVMTVRQLRDEYSTYEGKRKLAKRIDLVLAHTSVFKNLSTILGREFYKKKKFVLGINCDSNDLAGAIRLALMKTVLNISKNGRTSTLPIGHDNLSAPELTENVNKIANWLMRQFPGGWENISKLSVYVAGVPPLIVYMSATGSQNEVKKPLTKDPKSRIPVEDELSTLPGKRVRVHPQGEIEVLDGDASDND